MSLLLHFLCERFFVSNLLFFLLCSVVFSPPFFFFFLTVFLHLSFISFVGLFFFVFFFYFSFYVSSCFSLLVFISLFSSKMFVYACFVFAIFLLFRFSLFPTFFKNKFLFLWTFNLIFGIPCYQKKSPCSNFHFDRAHSYTFISRFFFYLLTLFMFPLLCVYPTDVRSLFVHPPHCYSPFFVAKIFSQKTFLSLSLLENLRASFQSPSSFTLFISFSETPSVVLLLFWFRLFSLLHFPSLFFRKITFLSSFFFKKKKNLSHEKQSLFFLSSNVSCILFSSLFVFVHHVSHSPLFFVSVFA